MVGEPKEIKQNKIVIVYPKVKRDLKKNVTPPTSTPQRRITRKGSKQASLVTSPKKGTKNITNPI